MEKMTIEDLLYRVETTYKQWFKASQDANADAEAILRPAFYEAINDVFVVYRLRKNRKIAAFLKRFYGVKRISELDYLIKTGY